MCVQSDHGTTVNYVRPVLHQYYCDRLGKPVRCNAKTLNTHNAKKQVILWPTHARERQQSKLMHIYVTIWMQIPQMNNPNWHPSRLVCESNCLTVSLLKIRRAWSLHRSPRSADRQGSGVLETAESAGSSQLPVIAPFQWCAKAFGRWYTQTCFPSAICTRCACEQITKVAVPHSAIYWRITECRWIHREMYRIRVRESWCDSCNRAKTNDRSVFSNRINFRHIISPVAYLMDIPYYRLSVL